MKLKQIIDMCLPDVLNYTLIDWIGWLTLTIIIGAGLFWISMSLGIIS